MKCCACSAENREGAKFCNECGARLDAKGSPSKQDAFEKNAAATTPGYTPKHLADKILRSRSAMEGEKKRVTVLFADIKGSTKLSEQVGAETWHHLLDRFFAILSSAVHRYEGTVNQYTGDGVMALFGAPIAHEDHAQRACLAALAMQQDLRAYAEQVRNAHGVELGMRVGLNSGEVIVGRIGDDLRMDYTAQGMTTHLAARMEQICEPGKIYLSRYTAALVQLKFHLNALGEHQIHGSSHPIGVFELQGEAGDNLAAAPMAARTRFVGRHPEMAQLGAAMQQVHQHGGSVRTVTGAAGLGKTRLCREFGAACARSGIAFYRAACLPYSRAMPLWPIRRLLRQRLEISDGLSVAEVRAIAESAFITYTKPDRGQLLPLWLEFLGAGGDGAVTTQTPGMRARLLDAVMTFLLTSSTPQVILIEDLHWIDAASEEFITALCDAVKDGPTLLLLNYRPDYQPAWLPARSPPPIVLGEFAGSELEELAKEMLGGHPSLGDVLQRIQQRTSGNPFFFEEAVRDLLDSGYLRGAPGRYELAKPIEQWSIPDNVHALLAARMDRLPDEQKRLLQSAAVIGQRWLQSLLGAVLDVAPESLTPLIVALESSGFLRARTGSGHAEFAFCHPLMQEVAYASQLESRRKSVHALLATHLQMRNPADGVPSESWVTVAHHWAAAGDWARAGIWNLRAAQWASNWDIGVMRDQVRAAMSHLDKAADSPEVARHRVAARAALVRMAVHAGVSLEETERVYQEGRRISREKRDLRSHADLVLSYGVDWLHRGDADAACALTAQAANLLRVVADAVPDHSSAEYVLYTHNTSGRLEEGAVLCRELLGPDWANRPLSPVNYRARAEYAALLCYRGQLSLARAELDAILKAFPQDDNTGAWVNAFLVDLAIFSGDITHVMSDAQKALKHAEAFGSPQYRAHALRSIAVAASLQGQFEAALAPLEEVRGLYMSENSLGIFRGGYQAVLAETYRGLGDTEKAAAAAEEAIKICRQQHARIQEMMAWSVLLALPRKGHWVARVPYALARLEELIAFTGANAFLPWLCQGQARWAQDPGQRVDWLVQTAEQFAAIGADGHFRRLGQGFSS
ncbi:MAG: adenylate/guanylate cyclase domain-containing protein [Pseudomonadota bacterium]